MKNIYVGGFGAGNLGDDLILSAILQNDPDATIVAYGPPLLDRSVEYIHFNAFMNDIPGHLSGHQTLVLGGGGIFWSAEHIQELLSIALYAKLQGMLIEVSRIGVHGFHLHRDAARHLLLLADHVSVREQDSLNLIRQELGFRNAVVCRDYAYDYLKPSSRTPQQRIQIGINIASTRLIDDPSFSNHVQQIYAQIAQLFADEADFYYIPFCTHVSSHNQSDLSKADLMFAASNGLIKSEATILSVGELLAQCTKTDIFIGERFHMHLVANAIGRHIIPLIHNEQTKYRAIAYELRNSPIYYEMSQPHIVNLLASRLRAAIDAVRNAATGTVEAPVVAIAPEPAANHLTHSTHGESEPPLAEAV